MTDFQTACSRNDTRGQHIAAERDRASTTIALAAHIYGKRSIRTKRIKDMMRDA